MKVFLITLLMCGSVLFVFGQEEHHKHPEENHDLHMAHHRVSFLTANSFIKNDFDEAPNSILLVPAFGINYDFRIEKKWGLGIHTDILLQQFSVESKKDEIELVRENPVSLCGVILFHPTHDWTFISGFGVELETHENVTFWRIGAEYGLEIPNDWELGFTIEYNRKINTYQTLLLGVVFSKMYYKD